MKVVVVGSGGYVGRALCAALEAQGHTVQRASSQDGTGLDPSSGLPGQKFRVAPGTEAVAFLAQSPCLGAGLAGAPHLVSVNVAAPVAVAAAAVQAGVRRFIYTSTGNVYVPSFDALTEESPVRRDDWYALTKVHAEESLALFRDALEVSVARLFGVFGPGQQNRLVPRLQEAVIAGRSVRLDPAPGESDEAEGLRLSLCYIDDAVRVLIRLLESGGPACLNIAAPEAWTIRRLGESLARLVGHPVRFHRGEGPRAGDLVADVSRLVEFAGPDFTTVETGLERVLEDAGGRMARE